ncbi:MAG: transporter substrate-binding protein, partial [Armatimonadota bacterium]
MHLSAGAAQAEDPIKVGILHSLSGTMAISETTLKDTMLMLVEESWSQAGWRSLCLRIAAVSAGYG